ncbi:GMC family oxidoreductase [Dickeya zeae]|uniref:GMC family oxidoreductase n=1 Tax=Dickeya zeae TaxID=204042 RepID=A0AAE7CZ25_9GAMM|nr:GMC family oxidoreductase N-terminal domain-containing protein [Dickeya zeae]QIZ50514.1 GMC family oxidoreductase [Dickeya zeae]
MSEEYTSELYDTVVIGSGFGGSVAAERLAKSGGKVVLLERGPWRETIPTESYGIKETQPLPIKSGLFSLLRSLNLPIGPKKGIVLNKNGYLEFFAGTGVKVICGSSVGGGSHIWAALTVRPKAGFWDNKSEYLSDNVMDKHYSLVFEELHASSPSVDEYVPNRTTEAWKDKSIFSEITEEEQPKMGILFPKDISRKYIEESTNSPKRLNINYNDYNGMLGSYSGAKSTVDALYILPALKYGLKVLSLHNVEYISKESDNTYTVNAIDLNNGKIVKFRTKKVILASGTMNTNKILFKSRELGNLNGVPGLGLGFGTGADCITSFRHKGQEYDSQIGTPVHGRVKIVGDSDGEYYILSGEEIPPVHKLIRKLIKLFLQIDSS